MTHFTNQEEENQLQTQSLIETTVILQKESENAKGILRSLRGEIETLTTRLYELEEETKSANARTSVAMRKASSLEQELRKLKTLQANTQGSLQTQSSTQKEQLRNIHGTVKSLTGTVTQLKACDLDAQSAMRALEERVEKSEQTVEQLVAEAKEYFYLIEEARSIIRRDDAANSGEVSNTPKTCASTVFALELERASFCQNSTTERAKDSRSGSPLPNRDYSEIARDQNSSHPSTSEGKFIPFAQDAPEKPLHFAPRSLPPASIPTSSYTISSDTQISTADSDTSRNNVGIISMKNGLLRHGISSNSGAGGFKYAAGLKYAALIRGRESAEQLNNTQLKSNEGISSSSSSSSSMKGMRESKQPLVVHCWSGQQGKQQQQQQQQVKEKGLLGV